ncbi:polysaccharide biosynthesis protein [Emticicia oligotrophica DSM 17448]|uniref:Polysaccharide biosynthesis protein n=1 Tax=Emticicia oligotrophica (strain DSM 17448 / CIP 109782 / MTCC 6937 / GPTSA100-15) TaxID=929562 RepID=A0ABN4AT08_EMTOG|nr:lipopolysaccharide biosynthesis protein [Emticicia oligotrophica]AFK04971.1 polysaccharide biosynthesis protein [Emticicia oligotrophica DSM 17448]
MKKLLAKFDTSFIERSSLMMGNILNAGLGFLTFGILARGLSKEDFGIWVLYLSVFGFVEMLRAGSIYQALVKYVASCHDKVQERRFILGAWQISLWLTAIILLVIFSVKVLFESYFFIRFSELLFIQYPVVICLMLPINMATMIFHSRQQFIKLWFINFLQSAPFLAALFFSKSLDLQLVVNIHLLVRAFIVVYTVIFERGIWVNFKSLFSNPKKTDSSYKELLNFSRFTVLSQVGSSLLKNVDIWLINHFAGSSMVALYQIPLKLVEIFEIPLRSWAMSAYPRFSNLVAHQKILDLKKNFIKELGLFTLGILPIIGILYLFAEEAIVLFAGKGYAEATVLLKLFMLYVLLLPTDRYLGITLDALNFPQINTVKVFVMLFINIIGDYLVLHFELGLMAVIGITLLNITFGIVIGVYFMKQQFNEKNIIAISSI